MIAVRIAIVLVVQTALLAGMIGIKQYTLSTGIPVLLETRPVDPRSLLRGDYARLHYAISTLSTAQLEGDDHYRIGDEIFVTLQQQGRYWQAVAIHRYRPGPPGAQLVIRGKVVKVQEGAGERAAQWQQERREEIVALEEELQGAPADPQPLQEEIALLRRQLTEVEELRGAQLDVHYLIEDYFVPEGEGRALEDTAAGQVDILVAVDKYGRAGILAVFVNGEKRYAETLF